MNGVGGEEKKINKKKNQTSLVLVHLKLFANPVIELPLFARIQPT